jgi:hypothetical protein
VIGSAVAAGVFLSLFGSGDASTGHAAIETLKTVTTSLGQ